MPTAGMTSSATRILVLAPSTADGLLTRNLLAAAHLDCHISFDVVDLCARLDEGGGALLLTDESLTPGNRQYLVNAIRDQPPWSDIPTLLLAGMGADSPVAHWAMDSLSNVTVFERPIRVTTLISALRTAKTARLRQYELRDRVEALRRSEQELNDFFENAAVGLIWFGPDGNVLRVNQTQLALMGYCQAEMVGRRFFDFHVDPEEGKSLLKHLVEGHPIENVESRLRTKDGLVRFVLISANSIRQNGNLLQGRFFLRDVTPRRQAEDQVRLQAHLLNAVGQSIVATDPQGTVFYWNHVAELVFGRPCEEAIGKDFVDLVVAPAERARARDILGELRKGVSWNGEMQLVKRDGTGFFALVSDAPVVTAAGRVEAITWVSVDIGRQKRIEHALRFLADASQSLASLTDYELTLKTIANLAVPHFADFCAVDVVESQGTLRRLAVAHVDPQRRRFVAELSERFPASPDDHWGAYQVMRTGRPEFIELVTDEILTARVPSEEYRRLLKQLRIRSYMAVPLTGRDRQLGVISMATAESGQTYTEEDLAFALELGRRAGIAIENAQLYSALQDADRRKDEFLATLAHELRNPLAPIRNSLHLLQLSDGAGPAAERVYEIMSRQVNHMVRLVDDLLEVARVTRGKIELRKEYVEVATAVHSAVETSRPLIEAANHQLSISLPAEPLIVHADPVRLAQVLANLLNNAAKYTNEGGQISLTVRQEGTDVAIAVRDNGIGIPPEMLNRVFDMFSQVDRTLKRAQGGLGIGLTLARNLIELHGGRIEAHSAGAGHGSEFIVRLPLARQPDEGQPHPGIGDSLFEARSSKRFLVVDDNRDSADSLAMLLKFMGAECSVVYDGPSALEALQHYRPVAIILDLGMPGMDGFEVARRIREREEFRDVLLVAMTGWGQEQDRLRTKEAGFDRHLVKPVDIIDLQKLMAFLDSDPARRGA